MNLSPLSQGPAVPALHLLDGLEAGKLIELRTNSITLGRNSKYCDLVFPAPNISRRHARIDRIIEPDGRVGFMLTDLESSLGTQLNDRVLRGESSILRDGDEIQIGDVFLLFQAESRLDPVTKTDSLTQSKAWQGHPDSVKRQLDALIEMSSSLVSVLDLDAVLTITLETLFRMFPQSNQGLVLVEEPENRRLKVRAERYHLIPATPSFSRRLARSVIQRGQARLFRDQLNDAEEEPESLSESMMSALTRVLMCAPLRVGREPPIGAVWLDTIREKTPFTPADLALFEAVLRQAAVAAENAMLHERLIKQVSVEAEQNHARRIQLTFLPRTRPTHPGWQFWDDYRPIEAVGGDYFGYIPVRPPFATPAHSHKLLAVVVADVAGKGLPAALIMARLSAEVRIVCTEESEPDRMLQRLNERLLSDELKLIYVTLALMTLDLETGGVRIARAGHPAPVIRRRDGKVEELGVAEGGPPLGLFAEAAFPVYQTRLEPGEVVVLMSDGLTEAGDPHHSFFGHGGVRRALETHRPDRAETAGHAWTADLNLFLGGDALRDDITVVCVSRNPLPNPFAPTIRQPD